MDLIEAGPEAVGLDTGVWSAPILVQTIKSSFGVSYSMSGLRKLLHRLGFSVQYPTRRLSKADLEQQSTWLEQDLVVIKKGPIRFQGNPVSLKGTIAAFAFT